LRESINTDTLMAFYLSHDRKENPSISPALPYMVKRPYEKEKKMQENKILVKTTYMFIDEFHVPRILTRNFRAEKTDPIPKVLLNHREHFTK